MARKKRTAYLKKTVIIGFGSKFDENVKGKADDPCFAFMYD